MVEDGGIEGCFTSRKCPRGILRTRKGLNEGRINYKRTRIIGSSQKGNVRTSAFSLIMRTKNVAVVQNKQQSLNDGVAGGFADTP